MKKRLKSLKFTKSKNDLLHVIVIFALNGNHDATNTIRVLRLDDENAVKLIELVSKHNLSREETEAKMAPLKEVLKNV